MIVYLFYLLWFKVLCSIVLAQAQHVGLKPRLSLEDMHSEFSAPRQRKYEKRSKMIRQQEGKHFDAQKRLNTLNDEYGHHGERFCNKSLAFPHVYLSNEKFHSDPVGLTTSELYGNARCSFLGAVCATEKSEHHLVNQFIKPWDTVLELGARYGTTSCVIAKQQSNSGKLVSVEPDYRVWNLLDENRREHNCNFWLLRGVIADQPAVISGTFYSTRASSAGRGTKPHRTSALAPRDRCPQHKSSNRQGSVLPKQHYTFAEIQNVTSLQFSALLIDCEGCIETAFLGNAEPLSSLLKNVNTVILEADMPLGAADCQQDCVDYAKWVTAFSSAGLNQVQKTQDPVYTKIYHYVFQRTN